MAPEDGASGAAGARADGPAAGAAAEGQGRRSRRESFLERKERRAAVEDPAVVLEAAARFLEPRARSVDEVRRRLIGNGYKPDLVEGAIERLTELGLLDDEAFARAWLASRDRSRPRGERAIRQELHLKGVDRITVDLVLSERREAAAERQAADDDLEGEAVSPDHTAAERLIARHARSLARVADPRQRRQRAYALLARNGFDPEVCRAVSATVDALGDESEPIESGEDD